ncbi:MAG TPA: C4-dicarboxylate ABC transporter, partial [Sphingomonadaceae bacterium]|nr:C4-dicarboxylate ABC transporter [Sphingomonadaceae bacterium]
MADEFDDIAAAPVSVRSRGILRRLLAAVLLLALAAAAVTWFMREEIADSIIKDQLDKLGLDARYEIESVGPRRQVLVNVVVGDPDRPDLTIERVETSLVPRFPFAGIGRIRLVKPRLYGTFLDGELSFGALDPILFERETTEPFAFPDMELILEDGRALIESDLGDVGIKAAGSGHLRGGFEGILAATSPELVVEGCAANNVTLYGSISIDAERPVFDGPLRLGDIACADAEISASRLVFALDARLDRGLDGIEGTAEIDSGAVKFRGDTAGALLATARFSWRERALTSSYTLTLENLVTPQVAANMLTIGGSARTRDGIARVEIESEATGRGLRPGAQIQALIGDAASTTSTSLLGPMLAQINRSLAREGASSTLSANLLIRRGEDSAWSLVVPEARWRGSSGQSLLALSRFQFLLEPSGRSSFSGNFATAGEGLPRIDGRLESRGSGGGAEYQLRLARYAVDGSSIAMPRLTIRQTAGGDFSFEGNLLAEGTIPGGTVQGLSVPLSGTWSSAGVLELWRGCTVVAFDRLVVSGLEIAKRDVRLCPSAGAAIARRDSSGFRLGANAPGFDIDGYLGEGRTPIAIHADAVNLAYPGGLGANGVEVELGAAGAPSRFVMNELTLDLGSGPGGSFSGGEAYLGAVPLDIVEAAGNWRYAMGNLMLEGVELRLEDRQELPRFNPLVAHDASLVMQGNRIAAQGDLREPRSDRIVTRADIEHDLGTQQGQARLTLAGLQFDDRLQPDTISDIALGLVANVYGRVDGWGSIVWDADRVTSTGEFSTDDLDFAAAFGPVEGVSGVIEFTDLLGFVTAPEQVLTINSFNPGIEVERGNLTYELRPGYEMVIHGGAWPFLGG